ncbi:hypothetical protein [Sphingomonas kyungheensis]|uniref:Uncharacterized protein n=1 Tax=Sphingomonas kyungheensis TaxID=1069987 RepID=A0ABU8H2P8_9SPHN
MTVSPTDTIASLDIRIAALEAEAVEMRRELSVRVVEAEHGQAGAAEAVDRLEGIVTAIESRVATYRTARDEAAAGMAALTAEIAEANAAHARARLAGMAREARKQAAEVHRSIDLLVAAVQALRECTKALWEEADGPTRRAALGELPRLLTDMPMVTHERLAHGGVLASRSAAFDQSAPAPSLEAHLDIALREIAPRPGRPARKEA